MYYAFAYAYPRFRAGEDEIVALGIGVMIIGATNIVG